MENHLHDCTACRTLLKQHMQCSAEMFESYARYRYQGDMTQYVMEHLPEMADVSDTGADLEQVNRRAKKHPFRLRDQFNFIVPLAATVMIIGLAYVLKANWPEEAVPVAVLGLVTYQEGSIFRIDGESDERNPARLKAFAMPGDRFETNAESQMMITLIGPTEVRLAQDTRILVSDDRRISVEKGRVFLDVAKGNRVFRVLTPNGTVTVFGTSFEVDVLRDELTVSVAEGEVQVERGDLFKQIYPGEQIHVTPDSRVMKAVAVDVENRVQWSRTIIADADAEHFFIRRIAALSVPDVLQADGVFLIEPFERTVESVELEWEPEHLDDSVGYQVYVFSDRDVLMFKGSIQASMLESRSDSKIRIYNKSNPQLRTQFAFVKIVPDVAGGTGGLKFVNCNPIFGN